MIVLGISAFFHDAAASLIKDGVLVAAVEEERFTRKKHDYHFPKNAIQYCLDEARITIDQVDYIAFYEKPLLKFERVANQFFQSFPRGFFAFANTMPSWLKEKLRIRRIIRKKTGYLKDIFFIDHHLSHAASSYLMSPFFDAALLTLDGVGELASATYGYGKGNTIVLEKEIQFPHSLGLLYSTVTGYCGFSINSGEYKLMGLSAYGKPTYYHQLKKIIDIKQDGSFALDMGYFSYDHKMKMPSKKFLEEFGHPLEQDGEITQHHKDMASSVQKILEETLFKILSALHLTYHSDNLCMGGGVALNSVANGKILKNTPFKNLYIQPSAGDGGGSVGAAAYVYYSLLNKKRTRHMSTAYLGPKYTYDQVKNFLDTHSIRYTEFTEEKKLLTNVAHLIYQNKVVGWFQGRMEFGPRALGARSILSNPCNSEMQRILNTKVKHREKFRPFAPAICVEDVKDYFECDKNIPPAADFMLMVYPIQQEKRNLIPAVTHVDGSGRLQVVRKEQNPRFYSLIKSFGNISNIPILINTSFNIRGEPIVCTPLDAYRCMMGTGIDYLVIENFLIKREDNLRDAWDSEKYATD